MERILMAELCQLMTRFREGSVLIPSLNLKPKLRMEDVLQAYLNLEYELYIKVPS